MESAYMKTITVKKCVRILEECAAIIIDEGCVTYPSTLIDGYQLNEDSQFLYVSWTKEKEEYYSTFTVKYNKEIKVIGHSIFLIDDEGDELKITPLFMKGLE